MNKITIQPKLKELIDKIDVSDSHYEKAIRRYESIAKYIKNSNMTKYHPDIYIQGSFKLGTAIRPITEDGKYDIDIVCNFTNLKRNTQTQYRLKSDIGLLLEEYVKINGMTNPATESKRCWTINYVDDGNFHVDILPSVPLFEIDNGFIAITDKRNPHYTKYTLDWETSNPKGYAQWFREQSNYDYYQKEVSKRFYAKIEKVPCYKVKTPLQRIVQIFKRHAEVMFENDMEYKPSSVIITTLVANQMSQAVSLYDNLLDMMSFIVQNIENGIEIENGRPFVANPVNRNEILSGKWDKDKRYFEAFNNWLIQLKMDFNIKQVDYSPNERIANIERSLFKKREFDAPMVLMDDIKHHKNMKWAFKDLIVVRIKTSFNYRKKGYKTIKSRTPLSKGGRLKFEVIADNLKNYEIYWQITNTGKEAIDANCLRGDFYSSEIFEGKRVRTESTSYLGYHYVEAFLVKNGVCYGKSTPFEVNVIDGVNFDFLKK